MLGNRRSAPEWPLAALRRLWPGSGAFRANRALKSWLSNPSAGADFDCGRLAEFLSEGADPNLRYGGRPLLRLAIEAGQADAVRSLLAFGANATSRDSVGWTPLHWACAACGGDAAEMVRLLLEFGADPNARADDGWTPLHAASFRLAGAALLLAAGADPDARRSRGRTSLHEACEEGDFPRVEMLLAAGADPSLADNQGDAPLHFATRRTGRNTLDVVGRLLAAGANPTAINKKGKAPADVARGDAKELLRRRSEAAQIDAVLAEAPVAHSARRASL